jgi:hypothetical protein
MSKCMFCDGPRVNGSPVCPVDLDNPGGDWRACDRNDPGAKMACRPCAVAITSDEWDDVDSRYLENIEAGRC